MLRNNPTSFTHNTIGWRSYAKEFQEYNIDYFVIIDYFVMKWCHSIYLNDRQFVAYKLFSLGIFA